MWFQLISNFLVILLIFALQLSFFNNLVYPLNHFNLMIAVIFLVLSISTNTKAYYWAILCGILLEIDSYYITGVSFTSLVLAVCLVDFIARNFIVHKSYLGTLSIIFLGGFFFQVFIHSLNYILYLFGLYEFFYFFSSPFGYIMQFVFYIIFSIVSYFLYSVWNKKIGHYFIYS